MLKVRPWMPTEQGLSPGISEATSSMNINCPICGKRTLDEFVYHGDATVKRPADDADTQAWVDYVYFRENPKGWHKEYWRHQSGCGAWLKIERHTVTHEIRSVQLVNDANGDAGGESA